MNNQVLETQETTNSETQKEITLDKKNNLGTFIYNEAREKLNISRSGKLYRQKWFNYIPLAGPIFAVIYAYFCLGKTRFLNDHDVKKFKFAKKIIGFYSFAIWPLIIFGLWTLLTYLIMDMSFLSNGTQHAFDGPGSYALFWNELYDSLSQLASEVNGFNESVQVLLAGIVVELVTIALTPFALASTFNFGGTFVHTSLIFIACWVVLSIINPVNIFNSLLLNSSKYRFVVIY